MDVRRVPAVLLVLSMARSVTAIDARCNEPLNLGNTGCDEVRIRWYYNQGNVACQTFQYTGCGGNRNNFYNRDDCKKCCRWDMECVSAGR
uniref:Conotoxin n=1 Tax=Conus betulinus TaxID=89764 RepID=A0A142C1I4_CONBE|nr:conotoxin [Conus betulinus]